MEMLILTINPGSSSTKLGLYNRTTELKKMNVYHDLNQLKKFNKVGDQLKFRYNYILDFLKEQDIDFDKISAVVGRGGLLKPIDGGTYLVNDKMKEDLKSGKRGDHASNLGGLLADLFAKKADCPSFIVDPVVVDEMTDVAKISGIPDIQRKSILHALNQKAVARKYAEFVNKEYEKINLIVAHLGGGISVGAHRKGKIIDVNNALSGDGPFSPNRSGGLPSFDLLKICFSKKYSKDELEKKLVGKGGVVAYLKTSNMIEVENMIDKGDDKAKLIFEAMAYQVAKEIGSMAAVLKGNFEAIILTGGIAYSDRFVHLIKNQVKSFAPVKVFAGEEELEALAAGAYRVLAGIEKAKKY
ncbi:MAG: butyrate kinase [Halanaerobiales bacterium]|nr:butyrate kinase [Halanaerobiales bacterium]